MLTLLISLLILSGIAALLALFLEIADSYLRTTGKSRSSSMSRNNWSLREGGLCFPPSWAREFSSPLRAGAKALALTAR
jgi:hypothetical protein